MNTVMNRLGQSAGWLAIAGGLLWIVYAIVEMLQPMGDVATFTNDQSQTSVTNPAAFQLAGMAGGAALALLGLAIVGAAARYRLPGNAQNHFGAIVPSRFGVAMGWVGALAGGLAAVTALLLLVFPNSAMQLFGQVLIAVGAMLVAIEANAGELTYPIAAPLFLVGALGLVGLLAQAMVPLYAWMLPVYAALAMAVYGFAWVRIGALLVSRREM